MRNYTKPKMFVASQEQCEFLRLYAEKTNQTEAMVILRYIDHLMQKHPGMAQKAAEIAATKGR